MKKSPKRWFWQKIYIEMCSCLLIIWTSSSYVHMCTIHMNNTLHHHVQSICTVYCIHGKNTMYSDTYYIKVYSSIYRDVFMFTHHMNIIIISSYMCTIHLNNTLHHHVQSICTVYCMHGNNTMYSNTFYIQVYSSIYRILLNI